MRIITTGALITGCLLALATACLSTMSAGVSPQAIQPPPAPASDSAVTVPVNPPPSADNPAVKVENRTAEDNASVQIVLIHYRGTPLPLGCCNNLLYERDEYVAIKNTSPVPQDIRGWKLINITKGYPVFTFPEYFPCMPLYRDTADAVAGHTLQTETYYRFVKNPADTVEDRFSRAVSQPDPYREKIDWSQCRAGEQLDQTPLKPIAAEPAKPAPCILYPGQTILVFTDEIHCQTGGFSFGYGQGNIWDNLKPESAVLYDAAGREVSRRSYSIGQQP